MAYDLLWHESGMCHPGSPPPKTGRARVGGEASGGRGMTRCTSMVPHPVCREADGLGGSGYASAGSNRASIR